MAAEYHRLFEVLDEIIARNPGIRLLELDEEGDAIGAYDIKELLSVVERDFRNMTEAERKEFEKQRYFWGHTGDGRVSIGVVRAGNGGAYAQFVEA